MINQLSARPRISELTVLLALRAHPNSSIKWLDYPTRQRSNVFKKILGKKIETCLKWEPCHSKIIQSLHGAAIKPEIRGGLKEHSIEPETSTTDIL